MHDLLGPLHERVDTFSRLVLDLQDRLVAGLAQAQANRNRLDKLEQIVNSKLNLSGFDFFAQNIVDRLEKLESRAGNRPPLDNGNGGCDDFSRQTSFAEQGESTSSDTTLAGQNSEQVMLLTVRLLGSPLGDEGAVAVEARKKQQLGSLKKQAHSQLEMRYRLYNACHETAEELPQLEECSLFGFGRLLSDRRRIMDCGLTHGDELILDTRQAVSGTSWDTSSRSYESQRNAPITVEVTHECDRFAAVTVSVDAHGDDTVAWFKKQAHAKLEMRYRLLNACHDTEETLPPLGCCRLVSGGSFQGRPASSDTDRTPLELEDRQCLVDVQIGDGSALILRSSSNTEGSSPRRRPTSTGNPGSSMAGSPSSRLSLHVRFEGVEVCVEASTGDSIEAIKSQALSQISLRQRFLDVYRRGGANDTGEESRIDMPLPSADSLRFRVPGADSPLSPDSAFLSDWGLANGARLELERIRGVEAV